VVEAQKELYSAVGQITVTLHKFSNGKKTKGNTKSLIEDANYDSDIHEKTLKGSEVSRDCVSVSRLNLEEEILFHAA